MSHIKIRRATTNDAALLAKLNETVQTLHAKARPDIFQTAGENEALTCAYRDTIDETETYVFIAEDLGEAVGYVVAKVVRKPENAITKALDSVFVNDLCVAESHQRRGYGSALMDAIYGLAREKNIRRVTLDVWDFNAQALEFYEKRGFVPFMHRLETHLD